MFQYEQVEKLRTLGPWNVKKIGSHHNMSIDDIIALCLLIFFGKGIFNNIDDSPIEFFGRNEIRMMLKVVDNDPLRLLQEKGILLFGIGGMLDEHSHLVNGYKKAHGESASTLISKLLGLENDRNLQKIIYYGFQDDTGTRTDFQVMDASLTLPNLLKAAYRVDPINIEWCVEAAVIWVMTYYKFLENIGANDANDWSLTNFVEMTEKIGGDLDQAYEIKRKLDEVHAQDTINKEADRAEILSKLRLFEVKSPKLINVAFIETDSLYAQNLAFENKSVSVVVVMRPTRHLQIYTRPRKGIDLKNVLAKLRIEELKARRLPFRNLSWKLRVEGELLECPNICGFFPNTTHMILCGSQTDAQGKGETTPLAQSKQSVVRCIIEGLRATKLQTNKKLQPKVNATKKAENTDSFEPIVPDKKIMKSALDKLQKQIKLKEEGKLNYLNVAPMVRKQNQTCPSNA